MPRASLLPVLLAAPAILLGALACSGTPRHTPSAAPPAPVDVPPSGTGNPQGTLVSAPPSSATASDSSSPPTPPVLPIGRPPAFKCKLDAPKLSDDPCSSDADCAPEQPCHAHACVAAAKATPATPSTMCTRMMDCQSVDANRCGCHEGRCALIPPP